MTTEIKAISHTLDLLRDKLIEKTNLALNDPIHMEGIEEIETAYWELRKAYNQKLVQAFTNYAYGLPQIKTQ